MAIYHLSVKTISRAAGRSATAAAAYRAGVDIADERTGELHAYRRRGGVCSADLVLPPDAPAWASNRAVLWNAAEGSERRKNSTVAREFEIALPSELGPEERRRLAVSFAQEIVLRHGCVADVAVHAPVKGSDERNHHAHILCSTRRLTASGFGEKTRELDDRKTGEVERWRERFAQVQNLHLAESGIAAQVDHRSLQKRGIEREPTRHLGVAATGYERRTGEPSHLRLRFEREAAERLLRAKEAGELERRERQEREKEAGQLDRSILDLSGDIKAAKAERDRQVAAAGKAAFRAQFEQARQIEAGKQQEREAFQRAKADRQAEERQAELARQQAEQREKARLQEIAEKLEQQRQKDLGRKQGRGSPGRSR